MSSGVGGRGLFVYEGADNGPLCVTGTTLGQSD